MDSKPTWDRSFMDTAVVWARRATCDRKLIGAVIVVDKRVIATGYNGAPSGWASCDEEGHLLVRSGESEFCARTVHAEANAILQCALHAVSPRGGTLYTTACPCLDCLKAAAQVGIRRVVFSEVYDSARSGGLDINVFARDAGIEMSFLAPERDAS